MKYLVVIPLILLAGCSSAPKSTEPTSRNYAKEGKFIAKTASYFCMGNKNFLPCVNSEIVLATEQCTSYVISNSQGCAKKHIHGANLSAPDSVSTIGVKFTQCAMLEMLEIEGKSYSEFEQCFNENYSQSNVHEKLNK